MYLYKIYIVPVIALCYDLQKKKKRSNDIMPASKAQQKAVAKYMKNNYDEIKIRVPKGKKENIQNYAATKNESVNAFINRAINEIMEKESEL